MKKIWWPVGACLLLIIIIMISMHVFRHDKSTDTGEYTTQGSPAMNGGGPPPDERQGDSGFPIVRVRPMPPGDENGVQSPFPGGRPVISGPGQERVIDPGYHPREGMAPDDNQPVEIQPEEQGPPEEFLDQYPDEGAYQDGNPEEIPPEDEQLDE